MIPESWSTRAAAWVGRGKGRIGWAIATPDGALTAHALDDDAVLGDAIEHVLRYLAHDLNTLGVDFHTNSHLLREVLSEPDLLAAAGMRVTHVTVTDPNQLPPGDTLLDVAEKAALAAIDDRGPVYLKAATDGGRARKSPRGKGGSVPRGGYGWVTEDGRRGFGPLDATCALESELVAIVKLLEATDAVQPLLVVVDSRPAIAHAKAALAGKPNPEKATKKTGAVLDRIKTHAGREVAFTWVKGHRDHAMNVAADELARLGRRGMDLQGSEEAVEMVADQIVTRMLTPHEDVSIAS